MITYNKEISQLQPSRSIAFMAQAKQMKATYKQGENTEIFNGISDWLYEEEFAVTRLFAFSPDSKQVAFVRLDETEVPLQS